MAKGLSLLNRSNLGTNRLFIDEFNKASMENGKGGFR